MEFDISLDDIKDAINEDREDRAECRLGTNLLDGVNKYDHWHGDDYRWRSDYAR
jgi:hypothetical protein